MNAFFAFDREVGRVCFGQFVGTDADEAVVDIHERRHERILS